MSADPPTAQDYYWTPRTPDQAAADLARIIAHYTTAWSADRVLVVGYSFGADVAPFLVNRLPDAAKAHVAGVALLGPSRTATFEFHLATWFGGGTDARYPTVPEIARLPVAVTCVSATDEVDSVCHSIGGPHVRAIAVGRGHHFAGDHGQLVEAIVESEAASSGKRDRRLSRSFIPRSCADPHAGLTMVTLSKYVVVLLLLATPAAGQPAAEHAASPPATTPAPPPAPAADDSPSWGSLFRNLGVDFKHLASTDTVVMLGVAGGASVAVHGQDARVTRRASGSAGLDTVFEPGAMLGGGALQIGGALATFALGKATSHPRLAMVGADLVRAQVVTSALTHGLKLAVDRQRPDGTRFSFPSGHTSATFASAAVLHRHFGWKAALPAYGLATYVAGSRLQENRHYMSDVIFGAALGIVAGRAVTIGRGQARFVVSPFAAPGGGGVGLTLAGNR